MLSLHALPLPTFFWGNLSTASPPCSSRAPKNSFFSRGSTTLRLCYETSSASSYSQTDRPTLSVPSRVVLCLECPVLATTFSRSLPVSRGFSKVIPELEPDSHVLERAGLHNLSLRFLSERVQQVGWGEHTHTHEACTLESRSGGVTSRKHFHHVKSTINC